MRFLKLGVLAFLPIMLFSSFATGYDTFNENLVLGLWLSENGKQKIEIFRAPDGRYYGKMAYMAEDDPAKGTSMLDKNNPNPALRNRRITGIDLMHNFRYSGGRVYHGLIYDPVSGSDYKAKCTLSESGKTASIRAYIGIPLFGRSEFCTKIR